MVYHVLHFRSLGAPELSVALILMVDRIGTVSICLVVNMLCPDAAVRLTSKDYGLLSILEP
jgi:hypothetical protein